jgi:uncharacterized membrane protein (DUF4010 family)
MRENRQLKIYSATTCVAAILTFALGAYAIFGDIRIAAGLAVAAALVLAPREPLHGWVEQITWPELRSALVLLAMSFIALPIIPFHEVGPLGGINPREVWLIAIALASASFAGYIAVKHLGLTHGALAGGAAGGLVSSTAVTISNARRATTGEGSVRSLAAGVAMASTVMFGRVLVIVAAINPKLLYMTAPPLLAAAGISTAYALLLSYRHEDRSAKIQKLTFRNPFGFWSVVGFALLLAVVIVAGRLISDQLGGAGASKATDEYL